MSLRCASVALATTVKSAKLAEDIAERRLLANLRRIDPREYHECSSEAPPQSSEKPARERLRFTAASVGFAPLRGA